MAGGDQETAGPAELERLREQFHRELMRKSMRIAELEVEIADLRAEFQASLSWRLTRPLRRVRSIFTRLRGHADDPW